MSKLSRVLFVIGRLSMGGAERVLSVLANELAFRSIDVCICCLEEYEKNEISYDLDPTVKCRYIAKEGLKRKGLLRRLIALRREIKRHKPDIIVSFMVHNAIQSILSSYGLRTPVILRTANTPSSELNTKATKLLGKILLPKISGAVFQNSTQKQGYISVIKCPVTIIKNPAEKNIYWEIPKEYKNKSILSVGRLVEQKNHILLIKAFARISGDFPGWILKICGEGSLEEDITSEINNLNLSDRVKLLGFVKEIHDEMHKASIFVLSSNYEGMPNVLIEAMCTGCACISTDFGETVKDIIVNNENGIIVPVNDVVRLSSAMKDLMADENMRKDLGQKAISLRDKLDMIKIVDEWMEFLEIICYK